MFTYRLANLGCKVNQYDGAAIAGRLGELGLVEAPQPPHQQAGHADTPAVGVDLLVINTCCVTASAMQKSRYAIRRAVRRSPGAVVLACGCYSQYDEPEVAKVLAALGIAEDKWIVAPRQADIGAAVDQAVEMVKRGRKSAQNPGQLPSSDDENQASPLSAAAVSDPLAPPQVFARHVRAFVKVQDGCDAFCSYCVVPLARRDIWHRPPAEVVEHCRRLVAAGYREIVLSGVFLGAYGQSTTVRRKWNPAGRLLPQLLERLDDIDGLWRIRLSSIEPADADDALLAVLAKMRKFAPHMHLPLQSGSGPILRRMNRQYTPGEFGQAVERITQAFDRPALTADIIVGFPGETDADFAATLDMARFARFCGIHAFPFSPIKGTAAWAWREQAPGPQVVKERLRQLAALGRELSREYRQTFVGQEVEALVEYPQEREENRDTSLFPAVSASQHQGAQASVARRNGLEGDEEESRDTSPFPAISESQRQGAQASMARRNGLEGDGNGEVSLLSRQAMTDRHLTIYFDGAAVPPGKVINLKVTALIGDGLSGVMT